MGRVSRDARLLFVQLWTIADDEGRLRGNSRILASLLFPYDDDAHRLIGSWLEELEREGCVARYMVDGATYLQVVNWGKHQKIDKPSKSKLPAFAEGSRIVANLPASPSIAVAKPREESSGDLDLEGKVREGNGSGPLSVEPERSTSNGHKRPTAETVTKVFDHWRDVHNHPHAKLDDKRRRTIRKALENYTEADLCQAIAGYRNSPHHMGDNDRATVFDDIELILRDSAHIDAGLKFYAEPPRKDLSTLTRRNVAATENWRPPEERNGRG